MTTNVFIIGVANVILNEVCNHSVSSERNLVTDNEVAWVQRHKIMYEFEPLLISLVSTPTTSFHEHGVMKVIGAECDKHGFTLKSDEFGNLLLRYQKGQPKTSFAFVSHMDHPGLEIESAVDGKPGLYKAALLGGLPMPKPWFAGETPVVIHGANDSIKAIVIDYASEADGIKLTVRSDASLLKGMFGVLDLPGYERSGDNAVTRAADDLAGCATILYAFEQVSRLNLEADMYCLFTRAEEVGLVGATLAAQHKLLPEQTIVVSVETSRSLPGATIGDGPAIRVGDRRSTFTNSAERYLRDARDRLQSKAPTTKVQRQLMSGGTCEATAFQAFGYQTTGLAIPLGNYHNVSPENTPAPEYVSLSDVQVCIEMIIEIVSKSSESDALRDRLADSAKKIQGRLTG